MEKKLKFWSDSEIFLFDFLSTGQTGFWWLLQLFHCPGLILSPSFIEVSVEEQYSRFPTFLKSSNVNIRNPALMINVRQNYLHPLVAIITHRAGQPASLGSLSLVIERRTWVSPTLAGGRTAANITSAHFLNSTLWLQKILPFFHPTHNDLDHILHLGW